MSWVYFAQREVDWRIKIGFSSNPHGRMQALTAEHGSLKTLLFVPGARDEESLLHKRFAEHRVEGEWFEPHEEVLSFVRDHIQFGIKLEEIPIVPRTEQFIFAPTARQAEAIRALTAERQAVDEHVSQASVIRELVQRGLDALQVSRSTTGGT